MQGEKLIWLLFAIAVVATVAGIWQFSNSRGYRSRGRRRDSDARGKTQQRSADSRKLSRSERKLYHESQRLLKEGKVPPAARILEQLNMPREAIQALEDHGFIDDAAKILMRMQRHNRAGVVYARHGIWDKAEQCFRIADMPLEVAKCARQAGNMDVAAEFFEKVGRFDDAAKCCLTAGDFLRAARLYLQGQLVEPAMAAFAKLPKGPIADSLTDQELDQIIEFIGAGHLDPGLADLVVSRNRLPEAVLSLCAKGMTAQAAELYTRATADIGPQLMAEINYHDRSADALAALFLAVSHHQHAGIVFERMGRFDRAAASFEKAEDFERAQYCYERAGSDAKAREMIERAKRAPAGGARAHSGSPFALASVTTRPDAQADGFAGDGESTAVIDLSKKPGVVPSAPRFSAGRVESETPQRDVYSSNPPVATFSLGAMDEDDETPSEPPHPPAVTPPAPVVPLAARTPPPTPTARRSVALDDTRAAFHRAKFLADLDFDQKDKMWEIGTTSAYAQGDPILTYNDEPAGIYIITEGSVSVCRNQGGRDLVIDTIGAGESFGELWLLADQPTAVRFVAATPAKLRVIARDAFNELLDKDGTIARKVYKKFTMRLLKRLLNPQKHGQNKEAS